MAKKSTDDTSARSRTHILRPKNATDYKGARLIDATSKTAAKLFIADQLYTCEVASPRHVDAAYRAGATMESASGDGDTK